MVSIQAVIGTIQLHSGDLDTLLKTPTEVLRFMAIVESSIILVRRAPILKNRGEKHPEPFPTPG